jgi:hypothetical protein
MFVAVTQAADYRDGDDPADSAWHDWVRIGAILVECKMDAAAVVMVY